MNPINKDTLYYYANTNEKLIFDTIKAVAVEFPGLGGGSCLGGINAVGDYCDSYAAECAKRGILLVYCFTGPWSWMNRGAVKIANAIVDAVYERFNLADSTPLISTGGSMGGLGALMFSAYSNRKPAACAVSGPCCDAVAAYYAHPDFPRTFMCAVADYDMPLDEALKSLSPLYNVELMPHIPYYIVHTGADEVLPYEKHTMPFIEKLKALGHNVTFVYEPGRAHCDITPPVRDAFNRFIFEQAEKSK
jgi:Dipeptidyl aminopeptidases/acylaminoacyl-peptidases